MNHSKHSFIFLATWVIAFGGLIGCANDDLMNPGLNLGEQTDVESASQAVTIAGPSAAAAESMIGGLMNLVVPTRAPGDPTCPPTFDLGNGITGTCSASGGEATFTFGGTLTVDSSSVTLSGTLFITATANQPVTGTTYSIAYDTSVSGPRGSGSWSATGTVTVDDAGSVIDFGFVMTLAVTPTGGPTTMVTAVVNPNSFELTVNGPLGGVLVFQLNRTTMTGQVLLNGIPVADVTIVGGCATIGYTVPGMSDEVVCSNDST